MATRPGPWMTFIAALFLYALPNAGGQEPGSAAFRSMSAGAGIQSGIRTDRLATPYLPLWRSIERVVMEKDRAGRPMYPVLHSLWQWAAGGPHVLYITMEEKDEMCAYHGGSFVVESFDLEGRSHVGIVRLFPPVIDKAHPSTPMVGGGHDFIQFEGLKGEKRYAEVLGHELAHAFSIFSDPAHAQLYRDIVNEVQFPVRRRTGAKEPPYYDDETMQHLVRRQFLVAEMEKFAVSAEVLICSELGGHGHPPAAPMTSLRSMLSVALCAARPFHSSPEIWKQR